jgi:hypothetical protein
VSTGPREQLVRHFELWAAGHDDPDPAIKRAWLDLFDPACTVEEPVGADVLVGVQATGWDMGHGPERRVHLEPRLIVPAAAGDEAATAVHIRLVTVDRTVDLDALGFWRFAPDGRIAGSRIFVASAAMGPDAWA